MCDILKYAFLFLAFDICAMNDISQDSEQKVEASCKPKIRNEENQPQRFDWAGSFNQISDKRNAEELLAKLLAEQANAEKVAEQMDSAPSE